MRVAVTEEHLAFARAYARRYCRRSRRLQSMSEDVLGEALVGLVEAAAEHSGAGAFLDLAKRHMGRRLWRMWWRNARDAKRESDIAETEYMHADDAPHTEDVLTVRALREAGRVTLLESCAVRLPADVGAVLVDAFLTMRLGGEDAAVEAACRLMRVPETSLAPMLERRFSAPWAGFLARARGLV